MKIRFRAVVDLLLHVADHLVLEHRSGRAAEERTLSSFSTHELAGVRPVLCQYYRLYLPPAAEGSSFRRWVFSERVQFTLLGERAPPQFSSILLRHCFDIYAVSSYEELDQLSVQYSGSVIHLPVVYRQVLHAPESSANPCSV